MNIAVDLLDERGRDRFDGSRRWPDGAVKAEVRDNPESIIGWMRAAEVAPDPKALLTGKEALTRADAQEHPGRSDVELHKRGAELVFGHRTEKPLVKASSSP